MKKIGLSFVFCLAFLGLTFFCPVSYAADTIKVGIVDTYSGPATTYTQDVLDGFKLAMN
jgi:branched-chain amino acid transport system substrate-binding protein